MVLSGKMILLQSNKEENMAKRQILLLAITLLLALTTHGQDLKVRTMSMNAGELSANWKSRARLAPDGKRR